MLERRRYIFIGVIFILGIGMLIGALFYSANLHNSKYPGEAPKLTTPCRMDEEPTPDQNGQCIKLHSTTKIFHPPWVQEGEQ